jgi:hypothetical protein
MTEGRSLSPEALLKTLIVFLHAGLWGGNIRETATVTPQL